MGGGGVVRVQVKGGGVKWSKFVCMCVCVCL